MDTTFIIPCARRSPIRLSHCLRNLRRFAPEPFQIVVATDGDGPYVDQVRGLAGSVNASVLQCPYDPEKGFPKAWLLNCGVRFAETELVCVWDADLLPAPAMTEWLGRVRSRDAEAFILIGMYWLRAEDGLPEVSDAEFYSRMYSRHPAIRSASVEDFDSRCIGDGIIQVLRSVWEETQGMCEEFLGWGYEDTDFRNQITGIVERGAILRGRAGCYHMQHDGDRRMLWKNKNKELLDKRDLQRKAGIVPGNLGEWGQGFTILEDNRQR